jgi:glycerol-3-phosphate acyltransferase PlsY
MELLIPGIALVAGYLVGAIPVGYLVAQWHGVDIFSVGSGNPGATNVRREIGKWAGNLVFALDALKGLAAAGWVVMLPAGESIPASSLGLLGLAGAIIGHSFSAFTRFRGGKGVAVTVGGAIALMPVATLVGMLVWVVLFYTTRYVSVASIGLAAALPVVSFMRHGPAVLFFFALAVAVFIIYRHRANIARLVRGEENRFSPGNSEDSNR